MKKLLKFLDDKIRTRYTLWDIGLLKTYGAIPGLVIGAYFPQFIKDYLWLFVGIFIVLFIRYMYLFFVK